MNHADICDYCPCRVKETIDNRVPAEAPGGRMAMYGECITVDNWCSLEDSYCVEDAEDCTAIFIDKEKEKKLRKFLDFGNFIKVKNILKIVVRGDI